MPQRDSKNSPRGKGGDSGDGRSGLLKIHVETLDAVEKQYIGDDGLVARGAKLDELINRLSIKIEGAKLRINRPSKNIMVMLVGNHSAGKSSFINYYINDDACKTSAASKYIRIRNCMVSDVLFITNPLTPHQHP